MKDAQPGEVRPKVAAHRAELIHRDIKPANLFLTQCGPATDFVWVLDFGLVKQTERIEEAELTAEAALVGTPAFVAPECAVGAAELRERLLAVPLEPWTRAAADRWWAKHAPEAAH